jgi:hypothetical protein
MISLLTLFKYLRNGHDQFQYIAESLHAIEKSCMPVPFSTIPQNRINGQEKLFCRLD